MDSRPEETVSLLLPYYLFWGFSRIFGNLGFEVLWAEESPEETEEIVRTREPDLAIEWQHGRYDFPICNLLKKYGRSTPVVLALNWDGKSVLVPEYRPIAGAVKVPFKLPELMSMFGRALPPHKRELVSRMWPVVGSKTDAPK